MSEFRSDPHVHSTLKWMATCLAGAALSAGISAVSEPFIYPEEYMARRHCEGRIHSLERIIEEERQEVIARNDRLRLTAHQVTQTPDGDESAEARIQAAVLERVDLRIEQRPLDEAHKKFLLESGTVGAIATLGGLTIGRRRKGRLPEKPSRRIP